jgi:predicted RNase H-like HicB family nuclease
MICGKIVKNIYACKFSNNILELKGLTEKRGVKMLIEYISKAMAKAVYEKLEDGTYSGKIPQCPGVIAFGKTLYQCQEGVKSVLEGWLIVKIRHGDKLPVIGGINLNNKMSAFKEMVAHG